MKKESKESSKHTGTILWNIKKGILWKLNMQLIWKLTSLVQDSLHH